MMRGDKLNYGEILGKTKYMIKQQVCYGHGKENIVSKAITPNIEIPLDEMVPVKAKLKVNKPNLDNHN